jgi:hypothetical protein
MYSTDPRLQPCTGGGAATLDDCCRCVFTEQCRADTLEFERLAGTTKVGIFGGLTEVQRIHLREEEA